MKRSDGVVNLVRQWIDNGALVTGCQGAFGAADEPDRRL